MLAAAAAAQPHLQMTTAPQVAMRQVPQAAQAALAQILAATAVKVAASQADHPIKEVLAARRVAEAAEHRRPVIPRSRAAPGRQAA
jgi:hypothetical protein